MASYMKIVLVDDEKTNLEYAERILSDYDIYSFSEPRKALAFCASNSFDLLLCDMRMPGMTGLNLIKDLRKKTTDFEAIILSAYTDAEYLMDAVNTNILFQYLVKPCEPQHMIETVQQAMRRLQERREKFKNESEIQIQNTNLRQEVNTLRFNANSPLEGLVGYNPTILRIKEQVKSFALSDHPVLISGEDGTGKKLVAQMIHQLSYRRDMPFVHVTCSSLPEVVIEEQFFGVSKEAGKPKEGFLTSANGGTLIIEDISELPKSLQSKILRFINSGSYYSLGNTSEKKSDVRIICIDKSSLVEEMNKGIIRKDFFYKISTLHIKTPPLRARKEDILAIMESLANKTGKPFPELSPKVKDLLSKYAYPGNIQELEGILEKINLLIRTQVSNDNLFAELELIFQENAKIYSYEQGDQAVIQTVQLPTGDQVVNMRSFVEAIEEKMIDASLKANNLNISQTARSLMISRQGLKNKIKRFGMPIAFDDEDDEEEEDFSGEE